MTTTAILDPSAWVTHAVTALLGQFVDGARSEVGGMVDRYLFSTVDNVRPGGGPFTADPALRGLNLGLVAAADVLLTVVVIVSSLRSMFERTLRARHGLKILLPRLLAAVLMIHFSLPLMQMLIDLNNALGSVARSLGAGGQAAAPPWSRALDSGPLAAVALGQDIFHAVFALAVVVALVILALSYVVRDALLGILVVLAPLAALCTILPETLGYARTWMRLFLVTVFMQAVQLVVLRVATVLDVDPGGGFVATLYALATLYLLLKVPGALNTASHLETKAKTLGHRLERAASRAVHHAPAGRRAST